MKTDLEIYKDLLDRAGVVYSENRRASGTGIDVVVMAGEGPRNEGYFGFYSAAEFGIAGQLLKVSMYE